MFPCTFVWENCWKKSLLALLFEGQKSLCHGVVSLHPSVNLSILEPSKKLEKI